MDVQAALCSCAVLMSLLSVNIHINMHNMHNMQNMSDIEFLLFMQDIEDSSNFHSALDMKFNACLRTICPHRVNAAMGLCACL